MWKWTVCAVFPIRASVWLYANVYGWASWNGTKATLALRNGGNSSQTYTFTLRDALNIPANVNGAMYFVKSFSVQDALQGFAEGQAISTLYTDFSTWL